MKSGITLAVIPARGGSKRLKNKNVLPLHKYPLLYYSLKAATEAELVDETIVSTDSPAIGKRAKELGGLVCFGRPRRLATDTASNYDVLRHAVRWWEAHKERVEIAVLLQPTSPLRTGEDIDEALKLLARAGADAVVSVTPVSQPPEWMVRLDANGRPSPVLTTAGQFRKRKQDLGPAYVPNGALYVLRRAHLMAGLTAFEGNARCYVMPRERSIDIDHEEDFLLAEAMMRAHRPR